MNENGNDNVPFAECVEGEDGTEHNNNNKKSDNSYIFIILFYLLGCVCFIPQNIYINATKYWAYKFRDPSLPFNESNTANKTTLQKSFTAYVGFTGNVGLVLFLFLTIAVLNKRVCLQKRIIASISLLLIFFVITLIFVFIDTDSWQTGFFVISLVLGGLLSSSSAVLLISLYQLVSHFPPRCLAAQVAGQSICGILAASLQIMALGIAPSVKGTASLYYSIAAAAIASTMVVYVIILNKSKEFQKYLEKAESSIKVPAVQRSQFKIFASIIKRVVKKLRWLIVALIICIGITGILHPGLTALIESSTKGHTAWNSTYFLPVCVFLLFNTFEFIGREGSNYFQILKDVRIICSTSVLRLILLPLILLCNLQPRSHLPVVFQNDIFFIIFIILLAVSSGYIQNIALVSLPGFCEPNEIEVGMLIICVVMIVFGPIFSLMSSVFIHLI